MKKTSVDTEKESLNVEMMDKIIKLKTILDYISCVEKGIPYKMESFSQVHIIEPNWNPVKIEQVIGRAIRNDSSKKLKNFDVNVDNIN